MRSLLSVLMTMLAATSLAAKTPQSVIRDVYASYGSHTLPAGQRLPLLQHIVGVRCLTVDRVTIDSAAVDGARAHVRATAFIREISKVDGKERPFIDSALIDLRKSGGEWRITRWRSAADDFADTVAHADEAKRRSLIASRAQLETPEFSRALAVRAFLAVNGDHRVAGELTRLAQEVADATGDSGARAMVLASRSNLERDDGDPHEALDLAQVALAHALESGDPDVLARVYNTIGRAYTQLDRHSEQSRGYYDRAEALADEVSDVTINARTYAYIGRWYLIRDDYFSSRAYYEKALDLSRAEGDVPGIAGASNALAATYANEGQTDLAIPIIERDLWAVKGNYYEPLYRCILASYYLDQGRLAGAEKMVRRAVAVARRAGGDWNNAISLELTGDLYRRRHRYHEAEEAYRRAGEILTKQGGLGIEPLAEVAEERGDYAAAARYALHYAGMTRGKDPFNYVSALHIAARAHRALGDRAAALSELREAVAAAEEFWEQISAKARPQAHVFDDYFAAHHELADLLVDLGRPAEALRASEMAKGRVLVEIARSGRRDVSSSLSPADRQRETQLQKRIRALNVQLMTADGDTTAARRELDIAEREYDLFEESLVALHPKARASYSASAIPDPEAIVSHLAADEAYLEYTASTRSLDVFLVRKTRDGMARTIAVRHAIKLDRLRKLATQYRSALAQRHLDYGRDSRALYELLIAPVAGQLGGIRHLCIVPVDALWNVPYESLLDDRGRFLVERFTIEYAPSIAVQLAMNAQRPAAASKILLACGNPTVTARTRNELESFYRGAHLGPLPSAAEEARRISSLYGTGSECLIGPKATEPAVKAHASEYRILHFATHAILDDRYPMYSRLVLAPDPSTGDDGLLQSWEILNLDLHAKLVVLSGCETAAGRIGAGEGLMGMAWAFLAAGARSTIASQWSVSSTATRDLMVQFHAALRGEAHGETAEALRAAQLHIMRKPAYRHPFYWAAFMLVSDEW